MKATYTSQLKELRKVHRERLALLEQYKKVFPIASEYAAMFSTNQSYSEVRYSDVTYSRFTSYRPMTLTLYTAKGEKAEVAYPIIDEMIRDSRLEMTTPLEEKVNVYTGRVHASFKLRSDKEVFLDVYIDMSRSCELIGTGKYEETKHYVCNGVQ